MVVGVATLYLRLPNAFSLKDRRRVGRSVKDRVRRRFNVAIAEVEADEVWTVVTLGIACVSNEAGHAHAQLERVVRFIERERLDAELLDYEIEIL